MPERPIRCKHFDLHGNPIDGGCRFGNRCRFIHPTDSIWDDVMPPKGRKNSDRFKDDRHSQPMGSSHTRRASRDSQSHIQHYREDFFSSKGESSRKHTKSHSSDNPWTKAPETSGRSSFDSGQSTNQVNKPTENRGWNSTDGWGWGDNAKDTGWGDGGGSEQWGEGSSDWGSGGWVGGELNQRGEDPSDWGNGGWGSGGWGEDTTSQSNAVKTSKPKPPLQINQSAPNSPSILSSTPAISRSQRFGDERGNVFKHPLSSKALSDTISPITTTTAKLSQDVDMKDVTSPVSSSASVPATKRARLPLPTRIKQVTCDAAERQPLSPSPIMPQDWTKIPLSGSITGRVQPDDMTSEASSSTLVQAVLTSLDPTELRSKLIKSMMHAVIIRYGLLKAEERKEKWRNARGSACYQHSTPAAQKVLESTNQKLNEEISSLTKHLKAFLKEIIRCSDALNKHKGVLERGVDQKKILGYTNELRDWLGEVDLEKRLTFVKETIDHKRKEREALRNYKQGEVNEMKNTVYELELKITDVSDGLRHLQVALPEHFQEEYIATEKLLEKEEYPGDVLAMERAFTEFSLREEAFHVVKEKIRGVDNKTLHQLPKFDNLREHIKALEEEVEDLRQKEKENIEFCKQASNALEKMEEWKKEDKARLDKLSQQIEALNIQSKPCSPPLHPINVEDLAPYINKLVTEYVATEIKPTLDAIADAANADSQQFTAEFYRLVEQVVMKTYDLVQMALKTNGFVPHFFPFPT